MASLAIDMLARSMSWIGIIYLDGGFIKLGNDPEVTYTNWAPDEYLDGFGCAYMTSTASIFAGPLWYDHRCTDKLAKQNGQSILLLLVAMIIMEYIIQILKSNTVTKSNQNELCQK